MHTSEACCIDRRSDYYARCADAIAADPVGYYQRVLRGRAFQASHLGVVTEPSPQLRVVTKYLKSISELPARAA